MLLTPPNDDYHTTSCYVVPTSNFQQDAINTGADNKGPLPGRASEQSPDCWQQTANSKHSAQISQSTKKFGIQQWYRWDGCVPNRRARKHINYSGTSYEAFWKFAVLRQLFVAILPQILRPNSWLAVVPSAARLWGITLKAWQVASRGVTSWLDYWCESLGGAKYLPGTKVEKVCRMRRTEMNSLVQLRIVLAVCRSVIPGEDILLFIYKLSVSIIMATDPLFRDLYITPQQLKYWKRKRGGDHVLDTSGEPSSLKVWWSKEVFLGNAVRDKI